MSIELTKSKLIKLGPGDKNFLLSDGVAIAGRSAIEISVDCPSHVEFTILQAVERGWLKSIAYVPAEDLTADILAGRCK